MDISYTGSSEDDLHYSRFEMTVSPWDGGMMYGGSGMDEGQFIANEG